MQGATLFPQPLGMAATWNPELVRRAAEITAAESRAAGVAWNFAPILDLGRQPLWPRLYETYGEDVYLASVLGASAVRGYEGEGLADPRRVASCLKHYVGYSFPATGHDRTPALIPEATMREYFLPPFAAAVAAGAHTVMVNSGEVNGIPGHVNRFLLDDVLRRELGFKGVVVSDWEDLKKLVGIHRVAATEKEATRRAILAGIDMSMVPRDFSFSNLLVELVEEGAVPPARIDEASGRILTLKAELGLFDEPPAALVPESAVGAVESRRLALEAARESLVLLKNEAAVLPLAPGTRLLVTGPTADSRAALHNGWTLTWQGNREALYPQEVPTVVGALAARFGAERVTHVPGTTFDAEIDVEAAAAAAARADVAVVCLGEHAYAETPGNIDDLSLPTAQLRLAAAVAATGKPVVLVLVEGRPRLLDAAADAARGIVLALNPGPEGGRAIAEVLSGEVNPSGRLPITYPRHPNALRTYDHKAFEEQDTSFGLTAYRPQFDFGAGLSYTRFDVSRLAVFPATVGADSEVTVSVAVKNTGPRSGAEVVQLYLSDQVASVTPPVKRLKRFAKVWLEPGESAELAFRLGRTDFSFIGADNHPVVEPGTFTVSVGALRQDFRVQ
jgi:beta-glucosidase